MPKVLIDVEARYAQAIDGIERVAKAGEQTARRLDTAFSSAKAGIVGLVGALSVDALMSKFVSVVNSMNALDDASNKTGASVEELSSLLNTLKPYGASLDSISTAAGNLARSMNAAGNSGSKQAEAFKALGIATKDSQGSLRSTTDVLIEIAKAFDGYADGTNKMALAQALLGRSGADLLPMLKDLAEAKRQDASVTTEAAAQAEQLNVELRRMDQQIDKLWQGIASSLVPQIANMIEQFNKGREAAGGFWSAIFRYGLSAPSDPSDKIAETIKKIQKLESDYARQSAPESGFFGRGARAASESRKSKIQADIDQARKDLEYYQLLFRQQLGDTKNPFDAARPKPDAPKISGPAAGGAGKSAQQPGTFTDYETRIKQQIGQLFESSDVTKAAEYLDKLKQIDRMFFDGQISSELYESAIASLSRTTTKAGADGAAALEAQAQKWRDVIDPTREYYRKIEAIDELVRNGALSKTEGSQATSKVMESLARLQRENAAATKDGIDLAKDLGVTFNSAFEEAVFGAGRLSGALKGLAQDLSRLVLRKTLLEPLVGSLMKAFAGPSGGGVDVSDLGIGSAALKSSTRTAAGIVQYNTFTGGASPAEMAIWADRTKNATLQAVAERERR